MSRNDWPGWGMCNASIIVRQQAMTMLHASIESVHAPAGQDGLWLAGGFAAASGIHGRTMGKNSKGTLIWRFNTHQTCSIL